MLKLLLAAATAVPLTAGLPGLGHAEGGGTVIVTSSHEYTRCIAGGGDEFYEEGDDIRICRINGGHWDGSEIWCDADLSDCEFVSVPPSATSGPGASAATGTSTAGAAPQAPGGAPGSAGQRAGMLQDQLQR